MPLITQETQFQQGLPPRAQPDEQPIAGEPTAGQTFASAFRQFNIGTAVYDRITNQLPEPVDDYDPLDDVAGYQEYQPRFTESRSPAETQQIKNRIDLERRDQQTIREAGGFGLAASFAAGALDPATLLSFVVPVAGVTKVRAVGRLVGTTLAIDTASELAFQELQETRTAAQSVINVGASAILVGALGSITARVPKQEFDTARDALNAELNAAGSAINTAGSTVGAASARAATTLQEETIAGVGDFMARTIGKISPLSRLLTSDSKVARQIAQDLAEVPYVLTKNEMGTAATLAVETLVKRYDATVAKFANDFDQAFQVYRKRVVSAGGRAVRALEFREQVAAAMRRGDKSAIPEVAALAKAARSQIIDPLTKELQSVGLLADPVAQDVARLTAQAVSKYMKAEGAQLFGDFKARTLQAARRALGAQRKAAIEAEKQASAAALKQIDDGLKLTDDSYRAYVNSVRETFANRAAQSPGGKLTREAISERRKLLRDARTKLEKVRNRERKNIAAERARLREARGKITAKAIRDLKKARPSRQRFERLVREGDQSDPALIRMAELARKRDSGQLANVVTVPKSRVTGLRTVGAESYLPRLYNVPKIMRNLDAWQKALRTWFVRQGVDPVEVEALTADVTRAVTGTMRGYTDLGPGIVVKAGPLKQRTLQVPDEILEPFLINDIERVLTQYVRSVAPQLELTRRFGDLEMRQVMQSLKDEYDILGKLATTDKARRALAKGIDDDAKDILAIRDRVLGKLGIPANPDSVLVRSARLMRSYNYTRLLGSQVLSSMADVGRIVTMYGMTRTAKGLAVLATNWKAAKLAASDAKRMAIGLDWTLNTRGSTLADIGEFAETPAEVFAQKASSFFTRATGMATWNSSMKFLASALQQDQILRTIASGQIGKRTVTKFAQLGLDEDMLKRIGQQYAKHGDASEGLARGRSELWDDAEAALAYESAILKAADTAVLTKGVGDTPLFMSTEAGKTIFQFKSFGMAATNRLLIPAAQGIQRGDLAMLNGLMLMLGLGVFRYAAKQWTADRPIETNPERLMLEAVDGAGLTTYLMDGYDVFAGMTGMPRASRYTDRSWIETAAGPSAGTITDLGNTVEDLRKDGVSEKDIHKIRKLMPGQNIFYLRRLINELEGAAGEAVE